MFGYEFEVYEDKRGMWRWRFLSNREIMADSGEGYATKQGCRRALEKLGIKMVLASIKELDKTCRSSLT